MIDEAQLKCLFVKLREMEDDVAALDIEHKEHPIKPIDRMDDIFEVLDLDKVPKLQPIKSKHGNE